MPDGAVDGPCVGGYQPLRSLDEILRLVEGHQQRPRGGLDSTGGERPEPVGGSPGVSAM